MTEASYQLIFLGFAHPLADLTEMRFYGALEELGIAPERAKVMRGASSLAYAGNAPAYGLYFGRQGAIFPDSDMAARLLTDGKIVLPVVSHLDRFNQEVPESLRPVNGFELRDAGDIPALVSHILEGFGLLRLARRLFISYRRAESTAVAIQLFEAFERAGFDVFLDTHSVPKGELFQQELWHRLADADVIVVLNTPGFLTSQWTQEEVMTADAMSLGMLQLLWPDHTLERFAQLSEPLILRTEDFGNSFYGEPSKYLSDEAVQQVIAATESLRARSLAARQTLLVREVLDVAAGAGSAAVYQPGKYVSVPRTDGTELVVIPAVGAPQAFTYYEGDELVEAIKDKQVSGIFLLYDHMYLRQNWVAHLDWLDRYLTVKSMKLEEVKVKLPKLL